MKDEIKTSAPATDAAPAAPKPVPKPAPKPRDPYIRAENEDDDGYDPYSDRRPERDQVANLAMISWDGVVKKVPSQIDCPGSRIRAWLPSQPLGILRAVIVKKLA